MSWIRKLIVRQVDAEIKADAASNLSGEEANDKVTRKMLEDQCAMSVHRARIAREDLEGSSRWKGAGEQKS